MPTTISTRVPQLCARVARRRRLSPAAQAWDPASRLPCSLPHPPRHLTALRARAAAVPAGSTTCETHLRSYQRPLRVPGRRAAPLLAFPPWLRRRRLWRASRRPRRRSWAPASRRRMCRSAALWLQVRGCWRRGGRRPSLTVCVRSGVPPLWMSPRVECTCGCRRVLGWCAYASCTGCFSAPVFSLLPWLICFWQLEVVVVYPVTFFLH